MNRVIGAVIIIVGVAFFIFWPGSKPESKNNSTVDYSYELREITAELREQTELLKRMIEEQDSQMIYLRSMDSYLEKIERDNKYR